MLISGTRKTTADSVSQAAEMVLAAQHGIVIRLTTTPLDPSTPAPVSRLDPPRQRRRGQLRTTSQGNSALSWEAQGYVLVFANFPDRAINCFARAMRLSPLDPLGYRFKAGVAFAHTVAKRYHEALDWVDRVLQEQPRHTVMVRLKTALLGHLERMEEAEEWIQRALELYPGLTITFLERYLIPPQRDSGGTNRGPAQGRTA